MIAVMHVPARSAGAPFGDQPAVTRLSASWSGVVYHAPAPSRALGEDELVAYELALQSVWTYCAHLNDEIERGHDPSAPEDWGWRYLLDILREGVQ